MSEEQRPPAAHRLNLLLYWPGEVLFLSGALRTMQHSASMKFGWKMTSERGRRFGSEAQLLLFGQYSTERRRPRIASSRAAVTLTTVRWCQSMAEREMRK